MVVNLKSAWSQDCRVHKQGNFFVCHGEELIMIMTSNTNSESCFSWYPRLVCWFDSVKSNYVPNRENKICFCPQILNFIQVSLKLRNCQPLSYYYHSTSVIQNKNNSIWWGKAAGRLFISLYKNFSINHSSFNRPVKNLFD